MLGRITPPVAIGSLFATARELAPFFAAAMVVLALVTFGPAISLWLPDLLMGKG